jgi:hypothetical protein
VLVHGLRLPSHAPSPFRVSPDDCPTSLGCSGSARPKPPRC